MICPFGFNKYANRPDCSSKCSLYNNGCLIAKALKTYIKVNSLIMAYNDEPVGRNPNEEGKMNIETVDDLLGDKYLI